MESSNFMEMEGKRKEEGVFPPALSERLQLLHPFLKRFKSDWAFVPIICVHVDVATVIFLIFC